jgi:hypothetical protein
MTLRTVTSSGGQAQLVMNYDGGGSTVTARQVIDVPVARRWRPRSARPTALSGTALANDQGGLDPSATGN